MVGYVPARGGGHAGGGETPRLGRDVLHQGRHVGRFGGVLLRDEGYLA